LGLIHRAPFNADHVGTALWCVLAVATLVVGLMAAKRPVQLHRKIDALRAFALCELLISPISWSHHWSWLALVPVVMIGGYAQFRKVSIAMLFVLAVAIAEPYWWNLSGWVGAITNNLLLIAAAILLVSLLRTRALVGPDPRKSLYDSSVLSNDQER
jgi:hypothetical protein